MIGLIDSLGRERAVWVGHDWGSPVVWSVASHHPERCAAVANLCVPYYTLERGLEACLDLVDRKLYPADQFPAGQWEYQLHYQEDFAGATKEMDSNPYNIAKLLFRKGDPSSFGQQAGTAMVRRNKSWFGGADIPSLPRDADVVTEADVSAYASALARNGFFGPNSYYMNHDANAAYAARAVNDGYLDMPVLFIAAQYDSTCESHHVAARRTDAQILPAPQRNRCLLRALDGAGETARRQCRAGPVARNVRFRQLAGRAGRGNAMTEPLSGIRVLEMATAIQGPGAAMFLGDMGAEVIKVEPPVGDGSRYHRGANNTLPPEAMGAQFISMNRGKRSVCIDYNTELGRRVVERLLGQCDVFLTNFRASALKRMGLDFATLHARHPKLVHASVNGFGPLGPDADKAMLDGAAQARGGVIAITGPADGPAMAPGAAIADTAGAMQFALAVMTALLARERTGLGQQVQSSSLGAQLFLQMWELQHSIITGQSLTRAGAHHPNILSPYGVYRTRDGGAFLFAVAMSDESWFAFCDFAGLPDLAGDPHWNNGGKRIGYAGDPENVERVARANGGGVREEDHGAVERIPGDATRDHLRTRARLYGCVGGSAEHRQRLHRRHGSAGDRAVEGGRQPDRAERHAGFGKRSAAGARRSDRGGDGPPRVRKSRDRFGRRAGKRAARSAGCRSGSRRRGETRAVAPIFRSTVPARRWLKRDARKHRRWCAPRCR